MLTKVLFSSELGFIQFHENVIIMLQCHPILKGSTVAVCRICFTAFLKGKAVWFVLDFGELIKTKSTVQGDLGSPKLTHKVTTFDYYINCINYYLRNFYIIRYNKTAEYFSKHSKDFSARLKTTLPNWLLRHFIVIILLL